MKITIAHTDKKNKFVVSTKEIGQFVESLKKDDARNTVARFREYVPFASDGYRYYKDMPTWKHVIPAAEFSKDANGNLQMKGCSGLLFLQFEGLENDEAVENAKHAAAMLPSTSAAFKGADGRSVVILVSYADAQKSLPVDETVAGQLLDEAYRRICPVYQALIKGTLAGEKPSLRSSFLMTMDAEPYFNAGAMPMMIEPSRLSYSMDNEENQEVTENAKVETDDETNSVKACITNMMQLLRNRYEFRYNTVMKYVEYLQKERPWLGYLPVDPRVQKRMTLEVQLADIRVSIRDVRNFLESDYIRSYNPIEEYLHECSGKWDGKDHIRALARTVPTSNPCWEDWFYTWFLAMVEQWRGGTFGQYGNSVAPLLISRQGYNKSTFCRRLLPPELQWGYNDNLILSEKRQVLQAMSQFLLVNLDEFNQISPAVQQGFLKNLIQLPTLKIKRPYGSHVEEFPRLASFIATSNMSDILSDPSGNRRFIGVELTGPIDVSMRPNYRQLYAQALAALWKGEKSYFDSEQVRLVIQNNSQFEVVEPIEQYFRLYFEITNDEKDGEYLTAAQIFDYLRKKAGSAVKVSSLMAFGRRLANMQGLQHKRFAVGMCYLVKKI